MSQPRLIRRIAEHMVGLAVGAAIIGFVEHRYRAHEQGLAALPVLDPWGIKYAYRTQLERGRVRGWVHGMAPPAKRPGVQRILALGDSVTYGLGVEWSESWPQVLEAELAQSLDYGLGQAEVYNFAMPGWDAEQSVTLTTSTLGDWEPDLVVWGSSPSTDPVISPVAGSIVRSDGRDGDTAQVVVPSWKGSWNPIASIG